MFSDLIRKCGSASERCRQEALTSVQDYFHQKGDLIEREELVAFGHFITGE